MTGLELTIGNQNYSSWSLRPWLALKQAGLPFTVHVVPLRQDGAKASILARSPSGKVPALRHGDLTVWDSLAICEYVAELAPEANLWPQDRARRAIARSVAAEMHSGFTGVRSSMPMNLRADLPGWGHTPEALADIARIQEIWTGLRAANPAGGPFLFGHFTIADAMFAPVATRFKTYGVALNPTAQAYVDAVLASPSFQEWRAAGVAETWTIDYAVAPPSGGNQ